MKYNGIIPRKFALLDRQILELSVRLKEVTLASFRDDWGLRSMVERALQVIVEIVIDIAERILALEGMGPAATAAEAIEKLVARKILSSSQPYVIVRQYEEIDPAIVFDIVKNKPGSFRRFREEIDAALSDSSGAV